MSDTAILAPVVRKLASHSALEEDDRRAILELPFHTQSVEREMYFVREGDRTEHSCLLLSGYAFRQKLVASGGRQILSIHIPGDLLDLQAAVLEIADHNVQALTRCKMATVARSDIRALAHKRPAVALAMWVDTLIDGSISREWLLNVGRRDAQGRIAHLLCEFGRRMESAGLARADRFEVPLSQEQLADATGLTAVHVNRTLRNLDRSGLIVRSGRTIRITDLEALRDIADFSEQYLHLDQDGDRKAA